MIIGRVVQLHALLPVTFRLSNQPDFAIEFVVDTGFTGFLTLPPAAVAALQLPLLETISAKMATDDEVELPAKICSISLPTHGWSNYQALSSLCESLRTTYYLEMNL